jgi:hypothetical protein
MRFDRPGAPFNGSTTHGEIVRTIRNVFPTLHAADHLERAARLTVRGKRRRKDVAWFLFRSEDELARLAAALRDQTWRPSRFELVAIRDPKPRMIARVPIADRIVHTAVVSLIEPAFLRGASPNAFACRPGLGTHRAALALLRQMHLRAYYLHLDIRGYFPSIDVDILRDLVHRRVRDRRFLAVMDHILEAGRGIYDSAHARSRAGLTADWPPPGRGLPIGSYTSQLFAAHVYLDALDQRIERVLRVPGYLRYVDDLFLFADRRADLRGWREDIGAWLNAERGLRLKRPRASVHSCRGELHALGHSITRAGIAPLPRVFRRFERRLMLALTGPAGPALDIERSTAATAGVVLFGI